MARGREAPPTTRTAAEMAAQVAATWWRRPYFAQTADVLRVLQAEAADRPLNGAGVGAAISSAAHQHNGPVTNFDAYVSVVTPDPDVQAKAYAWLDARAEQLQRSESGGPGPATRRGLRGVALPPPGLTISPLTYPAPPGGPGLFATAQAWLPRDQQEVPKTRGLHRRAAKPTDRAAR